MAQGFIVGRRPDDTDPIVRDGETVRVPLLLRDGYSFGGGLRMADGRDLGDMIANLSPEMRRALGLPTIHIEDGRGGIAGFRPGFAYPPGGSPTGRPAPNRSRLITDAEQAYSAYVQRISNAWKEPK